MSYTLILSLLALTLNLAESHAQIRPPVLPGTRLTPPSDGVFGPPPERVSLEPVKTLNPRMRGFTGLKSDTLRTLRNVTPVKDQARRGTCSIFASISLLESALAIYQKTPTTDLDLSEQWLQYLIGRTRQDDGSNTWFDIEAIKQYGTVEESVWTYNPNPIELGSILFKRICGLVPTALSASCAVAQRDPRLLSQSDEELLNKKGAFFDPEFQKIRSESLKLRQNHKLNQIRLVRLYGESEIRQALSRGIPVVMSAPVFYGAWNHRKMESLGIGERNMQNWNQGLVGYPNALDRKLSLKERAGHAFMLVGYDDNREIKTADDIFTGVYYFKNSWGTQALGRDMMIDGVLAPGYAAITQKYAHEFGEFFRIELPSVK